MRGWDYGEWSLHPNRAPMGDTAARVGWDEGTIQRRTSASLPS
jgi:hypothetical protein